MSVVDSSARWWVPAASRRSKVSFEVCSKGSPTTVRVRVPGVRAMAVMGEMIW